MVEKEKLNTPIKAWSEIIRVLDKKLAIISGDEGYGHVQMTIIVHKGKILEVRFSDEIKHRGVAQLFNENEGGT